MTTKPKPTLEQSVKKSLSARCFITRDERGRTTRQGFIHCIVPSAQGDLVLVQYFEALMGMPNTMALVPLESMVMHDPTRWEGYVLFEDDAHLRSYFDSWQSARDERIDSQARREK